MQMKAMTPDEFILFKRQSAAGYASDLQVANGYTEEYAIQSAHAQFDRHLPQGAATPENHLFTVLDENGERRGHFWYQIRKDGNQNIGYICDIFLDPSSRGKGFGTKILNWFEGEAKKLGAGKIALHVFGHNPRAMKLYESHGMRVTNVSMAKEI